MVRYGGTVIRDASTCGMDSGSTEAINQDSIHVKGGFMDMLVVAESIHTEKCQVDTLRFCGGGVLDVP